MKQKRFNIQYVESNAIGFGNWLQSYKPKANYDIPMEGLYRMFCDELKAKALSMKPSVGKKSKKSYSPAMKQRGQEVKAAIQLYCMENDIDLSPLQEFHIRLSKDDCETLDIYPISGKWHNITTGQRGQIGLNEIETFITKHFNI